MVLSLARAKLHTLPEVLDGLPNFSGWENEVLEVVQQQKPVFLPATNIHLDQVSAAFAVALHMHQPMIPAGHDGQLISNLQYMFEHPNEGDNHDAGPFANCYKRMGDMIPDMVNQGLNPRVMLDYSGTLLWGLRQMGRGDILESLKRITCDPRYQPDVEWLGTMWGHAVAPSTPIPDLKLHILAWQHHFAAIFGWEALARVKGFSPPEMALPNHPDTLYEYVKALKECGYRWLLVQEHSVETPWGQALGYKHVPHRLVARNSHGETVAITALIKTQGSDTKLVAQMQPYYETKTLTPQRLAGISIPPLVSQIGDGENGGVMMNEFPGAFWRAWQEMAQSGGGTRGVVGLTGTEYLELIEAAGCAPESYPTCQPVGQHQLWQRVPSGNLKPGEVEEAIRQLKRENPNFRMEGGSWTNDRSWVKGYENVLTPMNRLSALFHQAVDPLMGKEGFTQQPRYRQALLYNLLLQSSDFRYWGQGVWTEYAREIFRRGENILRTEF
jgi:hypothetical protein